MAVMSLPRRVEDVGIAGAQKTSSVKNILNKISNILTQSAMRNNDGAGKECGSRWQRSISVTYFAHILLKMIFRLVFSAVGVLLTLLLLIHAQEGFGASFIPASKISFIRANFLGWNAKKLQDLTCSRPTTVASSSSDETSSTPGTWELYNRFPQFLNQCSIQSFVFLLGSLRDPQTIRWVDNFTAPIFDSRKSTNKRLTGTTEATIGITSNRDVRNPDGRSYSKLLTYHGLGIMNTTKFPTWESYFATLLEMPIEVFVVQSSSVHIPDYELEINPASVCTRIISVREQIAKEFANDLGVLANLGEHTMDSYWYYMDYQRRSNKGEPGEKWSDHGMHRASYSDSGDVTMSSGDSARRKLAPHNLVFLEYSLDELDGLAPSPLRKGNFDLATLLATQESIHRLLNNKNSKVQFLRDFYTKRIFSHFTGIQRYGRADDFLEELLFSSGQMTTNDGESIMVDPVQLTERILKERQQVALEWQAMCKDIPDEHMAIKRLQLNRLMQSYNTNDQQEESFS